MAKINRGAKPQPATRNPVTGPSSADPQMVAPSAIAGTPVAAPTPAAPAATAPAAAPAPATPAPAPPAAPTPAMGAAPPAVKTIIAATAPTPAPQPRQETVDAMQNAAAFCAMVLSEDVSAFSEAGYASIHKIVDAQKRETVQAEKYRLSKTLEAVQSHLVRGVYDEAQKYLKANHISDTDRARVVLNDLCFLHEESGYPFGSVDPKPVIDALENKIILEEIIEDFRSQSISFSSLDEVRAAADADSIKISQIDRCLTVLETAPMAKGPFQTEIEATISALEAAKARAMQPQAPAPVAPAAPLAVAVSGSATTQTFGSAASAGTAAPAANAFVPIGVVPAPAQAAAAPTTAANAFVPVGVIPATAPTQATASAQAPVANQAATSSATAPAPNTASATSPHRQWVEDARHMLRLTPSDFAQRHRNGEIEGHLQKMELILSSGAVGKLQEEATEVRDGIRGLVSMGFGGIQPSNIPAASPPAPANAVAAPLAATAQPQPQQWQQPQPQQPSGQSGNNGCVVAAILGLLLLVLGAGSLYAFYRLVIEKHSISVVDSESPHRNEGETPARSEEAGHPSPGENARPGTPLPRAPVTRCHPVTRADIGQDPRSVHPMQLDPARLSTFNGLSCPNGIRIAADGQSVDISGCQRCE